MTIDVTFKADAQVDSFYYELRDTFITHHSIDYYEDFRVLYKTQTIRFGFEADTFVNIAMQLKIDGHEVRYEAANMGSSGDYINYHLK